MRRDHSPLRHNRLTRRWLYRRSGMRSLSACWSLRRRGSFLLRWRRRDRCRWRSNNYCRRRCRFFHGRWRRRNHSRWRHLGRWRCDDYRFFRSRRCRFGHHDRRFCNRGRWRRSRNWWFNRCRRGWLGHYWRRWRRWSSGRLLLLLLLFPEQPRNIARLGDPGEIDFRLNIRRWRSLSCSRAGLGYNVLAHPFSLILLN